MSKKNSLMFFLFLSLSQVSLATASLRTPLRRVLSAADHKATAEKLRKKMYEGYENIIDSGLKHSSSSVRKVFQSILCDEGCPVGNFERMHFYLKSVIESTPELKGEVNLLNHCYKSANTNLKNTLHEAAECGEEIVLKLMIKDIESFFGKAEFLNNKDSSGFAPVDYAISGGHLSCLKILVEAGATLQQRHYYLALAYGYNEVADYITKTLSLH